MNIVCLRQRLLSTALILGLSLLLTGCLQALQTAEITNATARSRMTADSAPTIEAVSSPESSLASPTEPGTVQVADAQPSTEVAAPPETVAPTQPIPSTQVPPPTDNPAPTVQVTLPSLTNEELWRQQQTDRQPFEQLRSYYASGKVLLWWFDPVMHQHVPLGWIGPEFQAQASFRLTGTWVEALEVPYHINQGFGLVLSDSLLQRIQAAGYKTEGENAWIETYVYRAPDIEVTQ